MSYIKNMNKPSDLDNSLINLIDSEAGIITVDNTRRLSSFIPQNTQTGYNISTTDKSLQNALPELKNKNNNTNKPSPEEIRAAVFNIVRVIGKFIIGRFITCFVEKEVYKFAIRTIKKHEGNKALFGFIDKEIQSVYSRHEDYRNCTIREFEKTSIFAYMMAEWRDKTLKEKGKTFGYYIIDNAITTLVVKTIPLPGSSVLAIPVKAYLSYLGLHIGTNITNLIVGLNKETLSVGINYRPMGFVLNNINLFTFNSGNNLIATRLKDPPEDIYKISTEDAKKILNKYKDEEILKKDIEVINKKFMSYDKFI